MQKECLFCKIISGELPSYKILENNKFLAILDIFPIVKGQSLVIPKKHYNSYIYKHMKDEEISEYMAFAKKVALLLDKKLKTKRTITIIEGLGINHAHIKLYPVHGPTKEFDPEYRGDGEIKPEGKFFDKYPGYINTLNGSKLDESKALEILKLLQS